MKASPSSTPKPVRQGFITVPGAAPGVGKSRVLPTSIVLKTAADPKRQHAAIGKLVKMCKESPVVSSASKGITAEVRRDRDRGHD